MTAPETAPQPAASTNATLLALSKLANFLEGKKTYIVSGAVVVYGFGILQGWWKHQPGIDFLLSGGGLASLRSGIGSAKAASASDAGAISNQVDWIAQVVSGVAQTQDTHSELLRGIAGNANLPIGSPKTEETNQAIGVPGGADAQPK